MFNTDTIMRNIRQGATSTSSLAIAALSSALKDISTTLRQSLDSYGDEHAFDDYIFRSVLRVAMEVDREIYGKLVNLSKENFSRINEDGENSGSVCTFRGTLGLAPSSSGSSETIVASAYATVYVQERDKLSANRIGNTKPYIYFNDTLEKNLFSIHYTFSYNIESLYESIFNSIRREISELEDDQKDSVEDQSYLDLIDSMISYLNNDDNRVSVAVERKVTAQLTNDVTMAFVKSLIKCELGNGTDIDQLVDGYIANVRDDIKSTLVEEYGLNDGEFLDALRTYEPSQIIREGLLRRFSASDWSNSNSNVGVIIDMIKSFMVSEFINIIRFRSYSTSSYNIRTNEGLVNAKDLVLKNMPLLFLEENNRFFFDNNSCVFTSWDDENFEYTINSDVVDLTNKIITRLYNLYYTIDPGTRGVTEGAEGEPVEKLSRVHKMRNDALFSLFTKTSLRGREFTTAIRPVRKEESRVKALFNYPHYERIVNAYNKLIESTIKNRTCYLSIYDLKNILRNDGIVDEADIFAIDTTINLATRIPIRSLSDYNYIDDNTYGKYIEEFMRLIGSMNISDLRKSLSSKGVKSLLGKKFGSQSNSHIPWNVEEINNLKEISTESDDRNLTIAMESFISLIGDRNETGDKLFDKDIDEIEDNLKSSSMTH